MLRNFLTALILVLLPLLTACSDDLGYDRPDDYIRGELTVDFNMVSPGHLGSRTTINEAGGEFFTSGDMIHVIGTFNLRYLEEGSTGDKYITGQESRYGALRYNGKTWEPVEGSELTWPAVATDGQFVAYYLHDNTSILIGTEPSDTYPLSNLVPGTDPLTATSAPNIPYGHAVKLEFTHICAYLTLVDMIPMVADEYWFTTNGPVNKETGDTLQFNNAFRISLQYNQDQPSFNFEFLQSPNPSYTPSVYIASQKQTSDDSTVEGYNAPSVVSYFLQPGFYPKFKVVYPSTETSVYDYLEYDFNNVQQNAGDTVFTLNEPLLEANIPYVLSITKAPGVKVTLPPSGDKWDESDNYFDVDVEEFLKAIYNEEGYTNDEGVEILQQTATGTLLLRNVDFNFNDYSEFLDRSFRPNNIEGSVFDGGYHYIRNLGTSLLRYNYGTIQNLGIKNAEIEFTASSSATENDDMSRFGTLCMWNRSNASIDNVRISDVDMTVNVVTVNPEGQETYNIGGVLGSNTGNMDEVELSGNFNITVQGLDENPVNAAVLIGGIIGQNAGEGNISNVSPLSGTPSFVITNNCQGPMGAYSVGGVVGESQGYISDITITDLTINGTASKGVTSYMGGVAGQLQVSTSGSSGANAILNSCIVSGNIRAGVSSPYNDAVSSVSYTGGIAGTVLNVPITLCWSGISVFGPTTAVSNVTYGTGGAIGRIREGSVYEIKDIVVSELYLSFPTDSTSTSYAGNFAGIVPLGQSEADYIDTNTIKKFPGVDFIGAALP